MPRRHVERLRSLQCTVEGIYQHHTFSYPNLPYTPLTTSDSITSLSQHQILLHSFHNIIFCYIPLITSHFITSHHIPSHHIAFHRRTSQANSLAGSTIDGSMHSGNADSSVNGANSVQGNNSIHGGGGTGGGAGGGSVVGSGVMKAPLSLSSTLSGGPASGGMRSSLFVANSHTQYLLLLPCILSTHHFTTHSQYSYINTSTLTLPIHQPTHPLNLPSQPILSIHPLI